LKKNGIDVLDKSPLGKGNFGEVWRGNFQKSTVAIKVLQSQDERAKRELQKELAAFR